MIERLKHIWFEMGARAKLAVLGGLFLLGVFSFSGLFFGGGDFVSFCPPIVFGEIVFSPAQNQFQSIELENVSWDGPFAGLSLVNEKGERYLLPSAIPQIARGERLTVVFDGENRVEGYTVHAERVAFLNGGSGFVELYGQDEALFDRAVWNGGRVEEDSGRGACGAASRTNEEDNEYGAGPLDGRVRMTYTYSATRSAICTGRVEINTWFILNPVKVPESGIVTHYKADNMSYKISTDGCPDAPGDHLLYTFKKGIHLSGSLPLTEENLGFAVFWPSWPQFSMQLPYQLTDMAGANRMEGTYTTVTGGGPWPAETSVVFEPLTISSDSTHCVDPNNPLFARPDHLEFCTEPTVCSDQLSAPIECFMNPERYSVIPFRKSFHWETPDNEPGEQYHIGDVDVQVEICKDCGDEFAD